MPNDSAHRRWWQIFEIVFGIPLLAAIALQLALPLAFPQGWLTPAIVPCGVALVLIGALVVALARRELARHGQPTDPGHPTSAIVTTGVFSFSRNPLYLGGICMLAGIALAFGLPWVLVLLVPALIACHAILVAPEERYLAATFGDDYQAYAARVHRWLGRARRP